MIDKKHLMEVLRSRSRRPMPFRDIASALGLKPAARKGLKRLLRELVAAGEVVRNRKGLYGLPEEMELVKGYFEAHRDGYGFVIQEKPGERDVFVPVRATKSAMDGDRVIAQVENRARRTGRIVRIIERVHSRVAGKLDTAKGVWFVTPLSRAMNFEVYVPPQGRGGAKPGQRVIVEVEEYPSRGRSAVGKVVKVLGKPESPKDEVESIIEEFGLPKRFSSDVMTHAKGLYEKGLGQRKDLSHLNTVTIDGERARDFDDAVSIERLEGGRWRLWVHVADVGHYVGWDSPLDHEARKRATSVYFPDRVIPMFPKILSEDLCSLRPQVPRPAFTAEMEFDGSGKKVDAVFYPSLIVSNERMTYTSVRKILVDDDQTERNRYSYLLEDFELMGELAGVLRKRRFRRGSLDFDLPEPEVLLDLQGVPEAILKAERNFAHIIIEEFMLAANEAVADFLAQRGVPTLYRIHEEPDPDKVDDVMRFAATVLRKRKMPSTLSELITAAKDTPVEEALTYAVLRSLKQARYSPENAGHFGLAAKRYTHFTSPIRRYPDLVVHRILREVLRSKRMSDDRREMLDAMLADISFHSSRMERLADDAERTVLDALRMWFMKDKVGEEFPARVKGVSPYGIKVRLDDFYVEGHIHISYLTKDYYLYDERSMALRGRHTGEVFEIGTPLVVRVDRVDLDDREIVFGLSGG